MLGSSCVTSRWAQLQAGTGLRKIFLDTIMVVKDRERYPCPLAIGSGISELTGCNMSACLQCNVLIRIAFRMPVNFLGLCAETTPFIPNASNTCGILWVCLFLAFIFPAGPVLQKWLVREPRRCNKLQHIAALQPLTMVSGEEAEAPVQDAIAPCAEPSAVSSN